MTNESLFDVLSALAQRSGKVSNDILTILLCENFVEEGSGLFVVVIGVLVREPANVTAQNLLRETERLILLGGPIIAVWLVIWAASTVAIDCHSSIAGVVVAQRSTVRAVDWNLFVILSESVAVGVRVIEKPSLEHLIVAGFDARNQV